MILKSYDIESNNLHNLHLAIAASGFVSGFSGLAGSVGIISIIGDELVDESSLDSLVNTYSITYVPDEITPRQARQALLIMGISEAMITGAINTLPSPTKEMALVEWDYSIAFIRHNPLVTTMGQMLGWNSEQLDQLWILGSTL